MQTRAMLSIALILTLGCTPYPRYRTGGAEQPRLQYQGNTRYTTNDYLRLGRILQSYVGKPYMGRSRYERGIDCSLFTRQVFKEFDGIKIPRTAAEQFQAGREIHRNHLSYGDLVFFRTVGNRVSHVGISIGHNQFIHASSSRGVIISSLSESYWAKSYAGVRRILEKTVPDKER